MTGFLVMVGIVFYGVMYSGLLTLAGQPISTLDALRGKISGESSTAPATSTGARPTSLRAGVRRP